MALRPRLTTGLPFRSALKKRMPASLRTMDENNQYVKIWRKTGRIFFLIIIVEPNSSIKIK